MRSSDLAAEVISAAVARSTGMVLLGNRAVDASEAPALLTELPPFAACALVLVGPRSETRLIATRWLRRRRRLVVVEVDQTTDIVQITVRDVGMEPLLAALRELLDRAAPWTSLFSAGAGGPHARLVQFARSQMAKRLGRVRDMTSQGWGATLGGAAQRPPIHVLGMPH